jgi:hypothetical protein
MFLQGLLHPVIRCRMLPTSTARREEPQLRASVASGGDERSCSNSSWTGTISLYGFVFFSLKSLMIWMAGWFCFSDFLGVDGDSTCLQGSGFLWDCTVVLGVILFTIHTRLYHAYSHIGNLHH